MADENRVIQQKLDNLASKVAELNDTVTITLKQFVLVTTHMEKKTVSYRKVLESLRFASHSLRQQSRTRGHLNHYQNGDDRRPF